MITEFLGLKGIPLTGRFPLKRMDVGHAAVHVTHQPILWVYARSSISFEPECLKWQIYLLLNGVEFKLKSTNEPNGSPNNRLPVLELPHTDGQTPVLLTDDQIRAYVEDGSCNNVPDEHLLHTIEKQLRISFLTYHLFIPSASLHSANLYFPATTKLISLQQSHQFNRLKASASVEIAKVVSGNHVLDHTHTTLTSWLYARYFPSEEPYECVPVDVDAVDRIAANALSELSANLASNTWILGGDKPTYADACLFAYLYLTLSLLPPSSHLRKRLTGHINLTHYTQRIASDYLKARI
ncbi:hypothetical protein E3P81_00397 [Wallemia ichthyophaga]|nr:hypothetical protein E3P97_00399 [Wallemia ichthyophaga]TIB35542.1 hypothetical protein E3P85_00399 [Wallemia ichthyophaga]TIB50668.1 hypothetical protein E3P82_00399 [Wallemia ichthyophaga]TIB54238.1 hypothetical protein E3P81_00397 [Wallemia ichthyophaga]TIB56766.1 hypothetical protein E3P80_00399 [Wallemia ichthyophaga]